MRKRELLRRLIRPTASPSPQPPQKVGVVLRVVNRIAAVVYPTNASGNNMSVR